MRFVITITDESDGGVNVSVKGDETAPEGQEPTRAERVTREIAKVLDTIANTPGEKT